MSFDIDIGFVSQTGRKPPNEDYCAAMLPAPGQTDHGCIAAIADGVSTGGLGQEAAQTTATCLVRDYYGTPPTWDTTVALDRIITAQNAWLCGMNRRRQPAMGMTTLTALVLRGHSYTLAHVGDTRCYLVRGGQASQLTQDHTPRHADLRHQLLRAVGADEHLVVDYWQGDLQVGDVFILLSDGVHGHMATPELVSYAAMGNVQTAAQALVDHALDQGSLDNASAMVVQVRGLQAATLADARRQARSLPIPPRLKVGEQIDGLVVQATIADNGINVLYRVQAAGAGASDRHYVLKTLTSARAHDQEERAMLAHEAWLGLHMQNAQATDHLVAVHDALPDGRERSAFYVLYDWHPGQSLEQLLQATPRLAPASAADCAMQALRALARLHRQGVIHRDIKPANLHLGDDGVLRLLDLGVALSGREPEAMRALHAGTPSYINPEQWGYRHKGVAATADSTAGEAQPPTAQSDLFALGVTLYQLLTGKLPYGEVLPYQVGRYHRDPTPPSRHNPEVPMWLNHVALKAVALDARQRFETAEEFLLALERGASRPLSAPPNTPLLQRDPSFAWKLATGILGLINLVLVYWLLFLPK